ncbi:MAG: helix-hairpin-helix domain-containing protein [Sulfurimonas sp.]
MKYLLLLFISVSALFGAVDINKASKEELSTLKGIGDKRADDILEYRDKNKCFKSVEELRNIKGIGDKFFSNNGDNISASKCVR